MFAGAFVLVAVQQVWMVITGRLVPRGTVDRLLSAKDAEIVYLRETGDKLSETVDKLTVPARLAVKVIETLQE